MLINIITLINIIVMIFYSPHLRDPGSEIFFLFILFNHYPVVYTFIDQFQKSEYLSCIWGKRGEILVLTVFNNSHPRHIILLLLNRNIDKKERKKIKNG